MTIKIEWTRPYGGIASTTLDPVTGCRKVSAECDHCCVKTFAERWLGIPGHRFENKFDVTLRPKRVDQPLRWKWPKRTFVNSMSDHFFWLVILQVLISAVQKGFPGSGVHATCAGSLFFTPPAWVGSAPGGMSALDAGVGAVDRPVEVSGHDVEPGDDEHRFEQPSKVLCSVRRCSV